MYHFRKPTQADLLRLAEQQSPLPLTYDDPGVTLTAEDAPPGFHLLDVRREIGVGDDLFDSARQAIIDWAGHRRAGAILEPKTQILEPDRVVAIALRVWPLWVTATCRIVAVVDEPDRFGFAYGTLPHHPACGEERFFVVRDPASGRVKLEVVAISYPESRLARLGGPIGRAIQRFAAGRYLDGFENPSSTTRGTT